MTKTQLIKLICLLIIIAVTVVASVLTLGFMGSTGVRGRTLTIATGSSEAVYSGNPLVNKTWKLVSGKLDEGHRIVAEVTGSQTTVGTSNNFIDAMVVDGEGNDVTSQYGIEYSYGTLTVKERNITVTAFSDLKKYDGTPLENNKYSIGGGQTLLPGHTISVDVRGSITNIGQTENVITSVKITDADGNDVTSNYNITTVSGLLIVYSEDTIVIESGSIARPYSGQPITCPTYEIVDGENNIRAGHSLEVTCTGSQTEIGESPNYFTYRIYDEFGYDVTNEYNILPQTGKITVTPQGITITSGDAQKVYDGTSLTNHEYTVDIEGLDGLFTFDVEFTGTLTEMGKTENTFEVTIYDQNGNDVTANFNIAKDFGELIVTDENGNYPKDNNGEGSGGEGPGAGGSGGGGDIAIDDSGDINFNYTGEDGEKIVAALVYSSVNGRVYLKYKSFGDYNGTGWESAPEYGGQFNGLTAFYLTSKALEAAGHSPSMLQITLKTKDQFLMPYYATAVDGTFQTSDVTVQGDVSEEFTIPTYLWGYEGGISLPDEYSDFEYKYSSFVYSQYMSVDDETRAYLQTIIDKEGFNANDPDVISKVAHYIQNAATYNLEFDKALNDESNKVIAFLEEYKEGVCQHYASSATLLFRTLGIPARYTIGFAGPVIGGETSEITVNMAHAWVEVYVDGLGWVYVEVTGSGSASTGDPVPGPGTDGPPSFVDPFEDEDIQIGGPDPNMPPSIMFTINASKSDIVYLKMKNYGNFNGQNSWETATDYDQFTSDGYSAFYITALALENSGLTTNTLSITPSGGYSAIPYYTLSGNIQQQTSDVLNSSATTEPYYVNYFNWDSTAGIILPVRYRAYEEAYREFVYENYTYIDEVTKNYMLGIIGAKGFSAESSDIVYKVANYIQNVAVYNLEYDRSLDSAENVAIAFLSDYQEGICQHYATAATLMFRALGIPARYTIGYMAEVNAGEETTVTTKNAHAWVEVYRDGIGWVNVEVTGRSEGENAQPIELTVNPEYTGELYNGKKHTAETPLLPNKKVAGLSKLTKEGYTYDVEISGENYVLGTVKTEITELIIYDPRGRIVYQKSTGYGADQFIITYMPGELQLYYSVLNFESSGITKVYDGIAYEVNSDNCSFVGGELQDGYTYQITSNTVIKGSGKTIALFKVTVYDELGVDRTNFYKINYKYGGINIIAREITVYADSVERPYNGTALVCDNIVYDQSALAEGDVISSFTVVGSQTNVGKSSNIITSIIITNAQGEDVTAFYVIKTVEGTLSVTLPK